MVTQGGVERHQSARLKPLAGLEAALTWRPALTPAVGGVRAAVYWEERRMNGVRYTRLPTVPPYERQERFGGDAA